MTTDFAPFDWLDGQHFGGNTHLPILSQLLACRIPLVTCSHVPAGAFKTWVLWQAEEAQAETRRLQAELQDCARLLGEAQAEAQRLAELVTGWEEAFSRAQQEIEQLKAAAVAPREVRMHSSHDMLSAPAMA